MYHLLNTLPELQLFHKRRTAERSTCPRMVTPRLILKFMLSPNKFFPYTTIANIEFSKSQTSVFQKNSDGTVTSNPKKGKGENLSLFLRTSVVRIRVTWRTYL